MKEEFDKLLCEKYPKIFANRHGDMKETLMCWGFCCGDGWFTLLDTLCGQIQGHIDLNPHLEVPQVIAVQVKEKFGTLRFYVDGGNDYVDGMIAFAEAISAHICEECGKPGTLLTDGWWKVRCTDCRYDAMSAKGKLP